MPDVAWDVIDVTLFNLVQFYQNADTFIIKTAATPMPYNYKEVLFIYIVLSRLFANSKK